MTEERSNSNSYLKGNSFNTLSYKTKKMQKSDQSFSNVLVLVLLGAVFATGATFLHDLRHRNVAPVEQPATAQQVSPTAN